MPIVYVFLVHVLLFHVTFFLPQEVGTSYNLSLHNFRVTDSGRYICVVESDNISIASQATELEVYGK